MAVQAIPGFDLQPSNEQVPTKSNYISDFNFLNQYLPDTDEEDFERFGNRSVASFLRMTSAELPSTSYLKLWSLLELLANRLVAEGIELTDFTGTPLFAGDHRASTATPRGRVYELAKRHYQDGQISPTIRDRSMWEATAVWSGRRNATAHYGRFHPDDTRQQSEWWYEVVLSSYESAQQAGGQVRFHDIDLQGLFEVTRIIVDRELRGRPMALGDIG